MTEQDAYLILNLLPGIGPIKVRELLSFFSSITEVFEVEETELEKVPGIGKKLAKTIVEWEMYVDLDEEKRLCKEYGVHVVIPTDPYYPVHLRELPDRPLVLYVAGDLEVLTKLHERGLGIVGTRDVTLYGEKVTRLLVEQAVRRGWIIVSGLARGVDTIAHRTTIENNGSTVAIIGSGLLELYPPENRGLAEKIREKGCILSELPLTMKPDKRFFPMRNRLISGSTLATIVTEAGENSGALITARRAKEQKKPVFAVPGPIDVPHSWGCHQLIREGAILIRNLDDLYESLHILPLGFSCLFSKEEKEEQKLSTERAIALTSEEKKIFSYIVEYPGITPDQLTGYTGLSISNLLRLLLDLELKRIVVQKQGKRYYPLELKGE